MATNNYYIGATDGWVQIATNPKHLRVSGFPHTHPYYIYTGSSAPSQLPGSGSGTVVFATANPANGHTVIVGSETYTFKTSPTGTFDVQIGAAFANTATNFANAVNAYSTLVTASNASSTVTLTAIAKGSQGNYTLTSNDSNVTASGATLTGGTNVTVGILICHHPFRINPYTALTENVYARIVNPVSGMTAYDGKIRLDVFAQ